MHKGPLVERLRGKITLRAGVPVSCVIIRKAEGMSEKPRIPEWEWWVLYFIPLPCFLLPWWFILAVLFAALIALVWLEFKSWRAAEVKAGLGKRLDQSGGVSGHPASHSGLHT